MTVHIVTITDRQTMRQLAEELGWAAHRSDRVRLVVQDGGIKIAIGAGSWSLPMGTVETRAS